MNLLTEEEAEKKWCPFSRVMAPPGDPGVSGNRFALKSDDKISAPIASVCITSACMAWRSVGDPGVPDEPIFGGVNKGRSADLRGYCGLAGRPE